MKGVWYIGAKHELSVWRVCVCVCVCVYVRARVFLVFIYFLLVGGGRGIGKFHCLFVLLSQQNAIVGFSKYSHRTFPFNISAQNLM